MGGLMEKKMMDDIEKDGPNMFFDEELKDIRGLNIEANFVEVTCGCTSRRLGDTIGKLRIFKSGHLEIRCDCTPECNDGWLDLHFLHSMLNFILSLVL